MNLRIKRGYPATLSIKPALLSLASQTSPPIYRAMCLQSQTLANTLVTTP